MPTSNPRVWRRMLIATFLSHRSESPRDEEIETFDALFNEIANIDWTADQLKESKLHIVFDSISELPGNNENIVHFRERALEIVERWKTIPDSPLPAYLGRKEQKANEAAAQKALAQQAARDEAAEAEKIRQQEAAVDIEGWGRRTTPPPLPAELIAKILKGNIKHYDAVGTDWNDRYLNDYATERRLLYRFCLVSRAWNVPASHILYHGRIHLNDSKTVTLLTRTVRENSAVLANIQQLSGYYPSSDPDFIPAFRQLVVLCVGLRYLDGEVGALVFPRKMQLPVFPALKCLRVSNQILRYLAPLLSRLPALEKLDVLYIDDEELPCAIMVGAPLPDGLGPLEGIPPPSFKLKTLHLSQTQLMAAQWRWLLESSTAIEYAQLQEIYESSPALSSVVGPHVKNLHIKGMMDAPQEGSPEMSQTIGLYTALSTLQVSGRNWPWSQLLRDINAPLETLAISYSKQGTEAVSRFLLDRSWQKQLQNVVVRHWADTDHFYSIKASDVQAQRAMLEQACKARGIPLTWIREGEDNMAPSSNLGPTESDLI